MVSKEKIQNLVRAAGLVIGLVFLQQLIAYPLFGLTFTWDTMPQYVLVNFGIVAGWYYFKDPGKKIPAFAVCIAAFCFAIWLRIVLLYLGVFRLIAPLVVSFLERQVTFIMTIITAPLFIPAMFAAFILLLLLPKAKELYRRLISNGTF